MRIAEFQKDLKAYLFNPKFLKYFSLGQQKVLLVLALFLFGILYLTFDYSRPPPPGEILKEIVVEVVGEIRKPGIYIFPHLPSLQEAIEKAGGLKEPAQFDANSSSEVLNTGALITIQKVTPSPLVGKVGTTRNRGGGEGDRITIKIGRMDADKLLVFNIPLDLNRVSAEDLSLIPGVGESLANEIIAYRTRRRGFRSIEELKNVKGIGPKKFKTLKPFLTLK